MNVACDKKENTGHYCVSFNSREKFEATYMGKTLSEERKKRCMDHVENHLGDISQREIARRLGLSSTTVNRWANELGYEEEEYTVNKEFFNVLNAAASYVLGYIFADGSIAWDTERGYYSLTITAAAKDKKHLERIRKLIESTKPLLYSKSTDSYRLIVNSKPLCRKLMSLGVVPRKSLKVEFPELPCEQLPPFLRGIIDGDGTVRYYNRDRSPFFTIRIYSGSKSFCEGLVKEVETNVGIDANVTQRDENVYAIHYSCSRGERLAQIIYTDAQIYLGRKYKEYKENILEVQ